MNRPIIGVGVIIKNKQGQILVGKRQGSHAPYFSIPGGHLELGESFEEAAKKEIFEETGLTIFYPQVIGVTNNLQTYQTDQVHSVSIILFTEQFEGIPEVKEPEKCAGWNWVDPLKLPLPHFEASQKAVTGYLNQSFYVPTD